MRTCKKCGQCKPLTEYEVTDKERGWQRRECKACVKARVSTQTQRSKEQIRAYQAAYHAAWYRTNAESVKTKVAQWVAANPEKRRANSLAHYYRLQNEAILHYGGYHCACCGETEPMFLTLDHVANNGKSHREEMRSTGGAKMYRWLRDNGYPSGFQVLCSNCNHGKYRNGGICPHMAKA
jgi:hypothetical protein